MQKIDKKSLWIRLIMVIAIILLVNFIASFLYKRFDLTSENRYSLSDSTIKLLENSKHKAFIKIYLDGEDLPAGFLRLRNATEDVLKEMNSESGGKIQYEFTNPTQHAANEDERIKIQQELISKGLMPTQLRVKKEDGFKEQLIFPCIQISVNGRSWPVQILENQIGYPPEYALNNSIISLEYKIANAIKKLTENKTYTIGIMQGHEELNTNDLNDLANVLTENKYEVNFYDVSQKVLSKLGDSLGSWFPQTTDLMIIAGPKKPFSEVEKFLDTPVKYYSSGMYVRLAFSVAAHLEPDILILDEVLSVGDAAFQKKSLNKEKRLSKNRRIEIKRLYDSSRPHIDANNQIIAPLENIRNKRSNKSNYFDTNACELFE